MFHTNTVQQEMGVVNKLRLTGLSNIDTVKVSWGGQLA